MANCVVAEAYRWAEDRLEWLGMPRQPRHMRSFAAARLRYTSLVRPEEASALVALANAIEGEATNPCSECSCQEALGWA